MEVLKLFIGITFFALYLGALPYMPEFVTVQIQNLVTAILIMVLLYWMIVKDSLGNWG